MPPHIDRKTTGIIFNIQKFSVHDGPGIRTVLFLKGCPMRCRWCSNPESQNTEPELAYNERRCLGVSRCGRCLAVCPNQAITASADDKIEIHRERCGDCPQTCVNVCPPQSLIVYGAARSVEDVLAVVEQDAIFYARSGGGITLSGGEPLWQKDFALAILRESKRRRINTSIETCGLVSWQTLQEACFLLDSVLFDIKTLDSVKHLEQTNAPLEPILENFQRMTTEFPRLPIQVRTPVVPAFNDTQSAIQKITDWLQQFPNVTHELLPYHRLGTQKYHFLGREYLMGELKLEKMMK